MLKRSGTYIGQALLLVSLVLQTARFWEALPVVGDCAKWMLTFVSVRSLLWNRIRRAEMTSRLKDANERPF